MIGILENGKLLSLGTLDQLRSMVKYQYSIRILQNGSSFEPKIGEVIKSSDGSTQIFTTEEDADKLSEQLIGEKKRFSIYPISLEDIFLLSGEETHRRRYQAQFNRAK